MSVAAHSPYHSGAKRLFEPQDSCEHNYTSPGHRKGEPRKARRLASGSSGRFSPQGERQAAYAVGPSTLVALRGLFPDMDSKVVAGVLVDCGDDIDAAIKRLGQLQLAGLCGPGDRPQDAVLQSEPASTSVEAGAAAEQALPEQHKAQSDHAANGVAPQASPQLPQTSEEWVSLLVQQMAESKDLDDARGRAAQVLAAFEQAVLSNTSTQQGKGPELDAARVQAAELARNNGILKRAVAIQNSRLQELGAKEGELQAARQLLVQYQEKLHHLELTNYSLQVHLRQATDSRDQMGGLRQPDVF